MQKISIIIPAFNEEATVGILLRQVRAVSLPYEKEIIVVDDGSTDRTAEILERLKKEFDFILVCHERNRGKGAAIRTALKHVTGEWVALQDADLESDPRDLARVLEAAAGGSLVVYGSRNSSGMRVAHRYFFYNLGGKILTSCFNVLFGTRLTDLTTGCKLFPAQLIKSFPLRSNGFEFCIEATALVARRGIPIKEVPIRYAPRTFREGKKLRWRDGVYDLWVLIREWMR